MQRKLPKWVKSKSPPNGMQINMFILVQTILLPLIGVGIDLGLDSRVLGQMWSVIEVAYFVFGLSCSILLSSLLNLVFSNPLATLLINARTSVLMKTRELERKDVPVPLGAFNIVMLLFCSLRPSV